MVSVPEMMSDKGTAVGFIEASEKETEGGGVPAGAGAADEPGGGAEAAEEPAGGGAAAEEAAGGGDATLEPAEAALDGAAALLAWRATLACLASRSMPCAETTATGRTTAESRESFILRRTGEVKTVESAEGRQWAAHGRRERES